MLRDLDSGILQNTPWLRSLSLLLNKPSIHSIQFTECSSSGLCDKPALYSFSSEIPSFPIFGALIPRFRDLWEQHPFVPNLMYSYKHLRLNDDEISKLNHTLVDTRFFNGSIKSNWILPVYLLIAVLCILNLFLLYLIAHQAQQEEMRFLSERTF